MSHELDELHRRVEVLERQVSELQAALRVQVPAAPPPYVPARPAYPPSVARSPLPYPTPAAPPPVTPPPPGRDIETQVAGVWFNRIAVFLLILAALYGFKWAVDNQIIGPTGRVIIGYLAALAMLGTGKATHSRGYRLWSLGITGGGMALLYVSTFAAYDFYRLIGYGTAFAMMVVFAGFGAVLSLYYDAVPVAWLSALGGFLTPFLLYTGKANLPGLFTYVALLDAGILALAYFRKWRSLDLLGMVATWTIYLVAVLDYRFSYWNTYFAGATLFFAIFTAVPVLYNLAHRVRVAGRDLSLILTNGLVYFSAGLFLVQSNPAVRGLNGFFAVAMALLYFLLGYLSLQRNREDTALTYSFLGLSGLFLTIAIPVQLNGYWIPIAWAAQSLVLSWIGLRQRMTGVRIGGLVALALAAVGTLTIWGDGPSANGLLKGSMAFAATAASLWMHAWLYQNHEGEPAGNWRRYLALAANLWTIAWWSVELAGYFERQAAGLRLQYRLVNGRPPEYYQEMARLESAKAFALSTLWAFYGFGLVAAGFFRRSRGARLLGIGVLGATLAKLALSDIWNLTGGYRVVGLFATGLVLLGASFLYFRFKDRLFSDKEAV